MNFADLDDWVKIVTILGGFITIISALIVLHKYIKGKRNNKILVSNAKPNITYFTDRVEVSKEIFESLQNINGQRLFQIYGPPGGGKTEFAKLINMAVNYNCQDKDEEDFIELIGYKKEKSIQAFLIKCENKDSYIKAIKTIFELLMITENSEINTTNAAHLIIEKIKKRKKTVFIFDEINNFEDEDKFSELWHEITYGLKKINQNLDCSFIIFYSGLLDKKNPKMPSITNFDKEIMIEYLKKRNIFIDDIEYDKLFNLTKGNVQLLSILADKYNESNNFFLDNTEMNSILDFFYRELSEEEKTLFELGVSLSVPENEFSIDNLIELSGIPIKDINIYLNKLEKFMLISKNENFTYSILESLLLPAINRSYNSIRFYQKKIKDQHQILRELFQLTQNSNMKNLLYSLKVKSDNKNYTATLRINYLLENVPQLKRQLETIDDGSFYDNLTYFIADALIGNGAYKEAQKIVEDNGNYIFRPENVTSENFDRIFLLGNLFHLQNQYEEAIDHFNAIIQCEYVQNSVYSLSKCLWAIAHCYRHMGKLDQAIDYYEDAIKVCKHNSMLTRVTFIKCMNEENSIFFYKNKQNPYSFENDITPLIKEQNSVADLSTNKYKAIKYGIEGRFEEAIDLIDKTLEVYIKKSERLRYNLYFEKGELLRRKKDYKSAIEYFEKSLSASQLNGDKNIELYSNLGILSVELESKKHYKTKSREDQLNLIQLCFILCHTDIENEIVCFELGKQHVLELKEIIDNNISDTNFYARLLPLF